MANEENLIPMGKGNRTESEERAMRVRGGQKSGETRRRKRDMKAAAKLLMDMQVANPKLRKQMEQLGLDEADMTNQMAVMIGMFTSAAKGNVKAAEFLRNTMGENPETKIKEKEYLLKKKESEYRRKIEEERSGIDESGAVSVDIYLPEKEADDGE